MMVAMEKRLIMVLLAALLAAGCGRKAVVSHPTVVPEPMFMVEKDGSFSLKANPKVSVVNVGQNSATVKFVMKSLRHARMRPKLAPLSQDNDIELVVNDTLNPELGDEGYLLEVRSTGIRLSANTEVGLFYAYQTFVQLLPTDVTTSVYTTIVLPECTILDRPRFGWRGLHIDFAGDTLSQKVLRRVVDVMAAYKMNRLVVDSVDSEYGELVAYAAERGVTVGVDSTVAVAPDVRSGLDSVRGGAEVVMEPEDSWSLDRYQADPRYQPVASAGVATLGRVYEFDPVPVGTNGHLAVGVRGGQCRLLTDYVGTQQEVEYMLLPRLLAVAEALWSPRERREWSRFRRKVEEEKGRMEEKGFAYCEGSFTPLFTARRVDDRTMNIAIRTEVPNTYIFYTTDMSRPTRESSIYLGPMNLERGTHIKILPVYKNIERDSVYEFVIR